MKDDVFSGWNDSSVKPSYDFDVIVEFEDGRKWIASWENDRWNFAEPRIFDCDVPVKRWMAFP